MLQAQKNLDEATVRLRDAQKAAQDAKDGLDASQKALDDYKKAPVDPDPTKQEDQNSKVKELEGKVKDANTVLGDKKQAVVNAEKTVKQMEAALEAARSLSVKTSAGGSIDTALSVRQTSTFNEANNDKMIEAVHSIVLKMFQPDFAYECLDIYKDDAKVLKLMRTEQNKATIVELDAFCKAVFYKEAARLQPPLPKE